MVDTHSKSVFIECPQCRTRYAAETQVGHCVCGSPLFVRYDLEAVADECSAGLFPEDRRSIWRYASLLPVRSVSHIVTLGEGMTPIVDARRLGDAIGIERLVIKDETRNPTFSFKDRGMCVAVSKHIEHGSKGFVLPSAGNAAVSLSAYAASAGVPAIVYMPADTPEPLFKACEMFGAVTHRVNGDISDCAKVARQEMGGYTDLSTTREPYRVEGKKTLAFEIAEQMNWSLPDAIVCPTGGGTAVIGIWKGIEELEAIGALRGQRPRLYAVQSDECAPVVRSFQLGHEAVEAWPEPRTCAFGLRVPRPFGGALILRALRQSGGSAVAVPESQILEMQRTASRSVGIEFGPETAAALLGVKRLVETGMMSADEKVLVLNTGTASRYWG
ncbi:MAG: threonine synthase [Candidatus Thorarchaeota archaeon]